LAGNELRAAGKIRDPKFFPCPGFHRPIFETSGTLVSPRQSFERRRAYAPIKLDTTSCFLEPTQQSYGAITDIKTWEDFRDLRTRSELRERAVTFFDTGEVYDPLLKIHVTFS
jgi:hypothetical protein